MGQKTKGIFFFKPQKHIYKGTEEEERVTICGYIEVTTMINPSHLIFFWIDFFWKPISNRDSKIPPPRTNPDSKSALSDMVATNHMCYLNVNGLNEINNCFPHMH